MKYGKSEYFSTRFDLDAIYIIHFMVHAMCCILVAAKECGVSVPAVWAVRNRCHVGATKK